MLSKQATHAIVIIVTFIWATNTIAGIAMESYEADQTINGIFMAIVGGALALRRKDDEDPK